MNCQRLSVCVALVGVLQSVALASANAADPAVERGRYLVTIAGCSDCHTPGHFLGKPDMARYLGGSDVGFEIAGGDVVYGQNLTMDKETGLGTWTDAQIAAAITAGVRPDGRQMAAIMPWRAYSVLTKPDAGAIVAYLRNLPAIRNKASALYVMKVAPLPAQNVTAQIGASLAEHWCVGCHDVSRTPQVASADRDRTPSFKAIAGKATTTRQSLDQHLSAGHTGMPDFWLSPYERSLLIGYIMSLR